jgi:cobalt-zinc-cadmium resistance protein CzcA
MELASALMAAISLTPATLSNGIGSETSKPLAIVMIGGLVTAAVLTSLMFSLFFYSGYRKSGQKNGLIGGQQF